MGFIRFIWFFLLTFFLLGLLRAFPVRMLAAWAVTFLPFWETFAKTVVALAPSFRRRIIRVTFRIVPIFQFSLGPKDELVLVFLGE